MESRDLKANAWWGYLEDNQKDLLEESFVLLAREETQGVEKFHDYAFIVFPAAKAYEGFLKKLFLDLGLISRDQYASDHFRIGRALNPSLPERFRDEWIYGKLAEKTGRDVLPQLLWETWREGRNTLFHWFPGHKNFITLPEARHRVSMITEAISMAYTLVQNKAGLTEKGF